MGTVISMSEMESKNKVSGIKTCFGGELTHGGKMNTKLSK